MFRLRRLLLLTALVLLLCACGHAKQGRAQPTFRLVETEHFALYTDLPERAARENARLLERLLFALREAGWEVTGELPIRLNVVMFRDLRGFQRFANDEVGGYAITEMLYEPWLVLPAPGYGQALTTVAHELTHGIAFQAIKRWPLWANEGIASYFESSLLQEDGTFRVGLVPESRFNAIRALGYYPPSKLRRLARGESDPSKYYGSAWLLVHYLMSKQAEPFAAFQEHLARGLDEEDAWRRAFPNLSDERLDQEVEAYATDGTYEGWVFDFAISEPAIRLRRLSTADQRALEALLWKSCWECSERDRGRWHGALTSALDADPQSLLAVALSIQLQLEDRQSALSRARQLVRSHPEHWLAWLSLGAAAAGANDPSVFTGKPEDDPGVRAPKLAPRQPYAWMMAASSRALRGEREAALAAVTSAERLQRSNPQFLIARATLLVALSACGELRKLVKELEDVGHERLPAAQRGWIIERVESCREPS